MLNRIVGHWVSCGVHVAARLGLADQLAGGPRTLEELASATSTQASSLYRLLRMLAASGVFRECANGPFREYRAIGDTPFGRRKLDARVGDNDGPSRLE
jgi:hypothetical protein